MPGCRNCQAEIAGRARDHQFELAAELQQRHHAAEQDREGQHLLGDRGGAVEGELRHQAGVAALGVAGAAHQLDEIERVDQHEDGPEHPQDRPAAKRIER